MNIKHKDLEIPKDDPFANCKLGREKNAKVLTSIVEHYADGFVLAINNTWGTGKTTFLKMWRQNLENTHFKTIYFNAWENDFENTPLTALMGEMKTLVSDKKSQATFNSLAKKAGVLAKNVAPALLAAITAKYVGIQNMDEFIKKITEASVNIIEDEIDKYSKKKKSLTEFRQKLSEFIEELNSDKPIVFMIDELDRCRPNYAVEVLENIKHFFGVPKIVFVLSIDKEQLSHAIRGVYGSENIDSTEYLRRIIDLEYKIPDPDTNRFCEYLYDYFEFDSFFESAERNKHNAFHNDGEYFFSIASTLFNSSKLTLRQQEQVFAYSRLVLKTLGPASYVFPEIMIFFILLKYNNPVLFMKVQNKVLTLQELNSELNQALPDLDDKSEINLRYLIRLQAKILYRYKISIDPNERIPVFQKDPSSGEEVFPLKSKYDSSTDSSWFQKTYQEVSSDYFSSRLGLDYILNNISLFNNIIQ